MTLRGHFLQALLAEHGRHALLSHLDHTEENKAGDMLTNVTMIIANMK